MLVAQRGANRKSDGCKGGKMSAHLQQLQGTALLLLETTLSVEVRLQSEEVPGSVEMLSVRLLSMSGGGKIELCLSSEDNLFFHCVHEMDAARYEASVRAEQHLVTPFEEYGQMLRGLILQCSAKPEEHAAILVRVSTKKKKEEEDDDEQRQLLLTEKEKGRFSTSTDSQKGKNNRSMATSLHEEVGTLNIGETQMPSLLDISRSQGQTFRLDFIANAGFKFVELLRCHFSGSQDRFVHALAQNRYNDLRARIRMYEARLADFGSMVKTKSPSLLSHQQGSSQYSSTFPSSVDHHHHSVASKSLKPRSVSKLGGTPSVRQPSHVSR